MRITSILMMTSTLLGGAQLSQAKSVPFDHQHLSWNMTLKSHVKYDKGVSTVDYAAIKKSPKVLDAYLGSLSAVKPDQYKSWSRDQQLAFMINAYNAFTIKLIIDNYPLKSIKKIGGWFSNPWKKEFFTLLGKKRWLDWIEHDVIRPEFKEPRIHFAVNCASIGCPALLNEAFTAKKLEEQLERAGKDFVTYRNRLVFGSDQSKPKKLEVSMIFKWYGEDFNEQFGSYLGYVSRHITQDPKIQQQILDKKIDVDYIDYDWDLNKTP